MQLDPAFEQALARGDAWAVSSTGLSADELAWLLPADRRGISADRNQARRQQFLRNVSAEFQLTLSQLPADTLGDFTSSAEFHTAVSGSSSLPLALGAYLRSLRAAQLPPSSALLALELRLAELRRTPPPPAVDPTAAPPAPGDGVRCAPGVELLELPSGTLELASWLRLHSGSTAAATQPKIAPNRTETLLLRPDFGAPAWQTREVYVEALPSPIAAFLRRARHSMTPAERSDYARRVDAPPETIEALVSDLLSDGILVVAKGS